MASRIALIHAALSCCAANKLKQLLVLTRHYLQPTHTFTRNCVPPQRASHTNPLNRPLPQISPLSEASVEELQWAPRTTQEGAFGAFELQVCACLWCCGVFVGVCGCQGRAALVSENEAVLYHLVVADSCRSLLVELAEVAVCVCRVGLVNAEAAYSQPCHHVAPCRVFTVIVTTGWWSGRWSQVGCAPFYI